MKANFYAKRSWRHFSKKKKRQNIILPFCEAVSQKSKNKTGKGSESSQKNSELFQVAKSALGLLHQREKKQGPFFAEFFFCYFARWLLFFN